MVKIPAAMNEAESIDGKLNHPGPICLAWTETKRKECWQTGDGNEFCYQVHHGKDTYYWNGQKRGDPKGARHMGEPELMDTCQDMCQQLPTIEEGVMMDAIEADHEHQMTLQYYHQVWNSIDLFTETADMCDGCKK